MMYIIFFVNFAMAYRYSRGHESFGNMRLMIERQGIYDDGPQSSATCNHLNQLNHEQELEISREEVAGSLQTGQEKQIRIVEAKYSSCPNIDVAEFLSFFNPSPMIDSEPPPKIPQRQAEERSSFVEQFDIASNDESGGTTIFHPLSVEESISPESRSIQQQHHAHSQPQNKDKSYNKNLACYISRSVRRLIFGKFQLSTIKHCQRRGFSFEGFQLFCQDSKFSGINSIKSFYSSTGNITENKMGELFRHLYQKILRRSYIRTVIEEGKMTNIEAYIDYKNKYLLNLA